MVATVSFIILLFVFDILMNFLVVLSTCTFPGGLSAGGAVLQVLHQLILGTPKSPHSNKNFINRPLQYVLLPLLQLFTSMELLLL